MCIHRFLKCYTFSYKITWWILFAYDLNLANGIFCDKLKNIKYYCIKKKKIKRKKEKEKDETG